MRIDNREILLEVCCGSAEDVMAAGANDRGGLLINSSRGVLYASSGEDFADAAAGAARSLAFLLS